MLLKTRSKVHSLHSSQDQLVTPLQINYSIFVILLLFHWFKQAKFAYGGLILSSRQFLILLKLPQKMKLASNMVKIDSKIIDLNSENSLYDWKIFMTSFVKALSFFTKFSHSLKNSLSFINDIFFKFLIAWKVY